MTVNTEGVQKVKHTKIIQVQFRDIGFITVKQNTSCTIISNHLRLLRGLGNYWFRCHTKVRKGN